MTQFVNGDYLTPSLLNSKLASATTSAGYSTNTLVPESGNTVSTLTSVLSTSLFASTATISSATISAATIDRGFVRSSFLSAVTLGSGAPSTNTGKILDVAHSGTADGNNQMAMFERTVTSSGAFWVNATQTRARTTHSSGTVNIVAGVNGIVEVAGTGSVSSARGVIGIASTTGGGNITHAVSVYADDPLSSGGGVIENAYDFYGEAVDTGTNRHGLYLADVAGGTTNWAIRTNAGDAYIGDALTFKAGNSTGTARASGVLNAANAVFTTQTGLTSIHSYSVRANTLENAGDTLRVAYQGYTISSMGTFALSLGSVTLISNLTVSADGSFHESVWVTRRDATHVDWSREGMRFTGVTVSDLARSAGSAVLDLASAQSMNFSGSASAGTCFASLAQTVLESVP